jgi:hypothetical protein
MGFERIIGVTTKSGGPAPPTRVRRETGQAARLPGNSVASGKPPNARKHEGRETIKTCTNEQQP